MTGHAKRPRDAVNKKLGESSPEMKINEQDSYLPDDDADHEHWLRDNVPPHHA